MGLTSFGFFCFVTVLVLAYYLLPRKTQWAVLLGGSLFFFVWSSGWTVVYLIAAAGIVYASALRIAKIGDAFEAHKKELEKEERKRMRSVVRKKQKFVLAWTVVGAVALLAVLKYIGVPCRVINFVAGENTVPVLKFAVPLGISYYTLMAVGYVTDVYRGAQKAEKNPLRLLLYLCWFPHITEGPFDTYGALSDQFSRPHAFDYDRLVNAVSLMLVGLVKKLVISDRIAYYSNEIFDHADRYAGYVVFLGMVIYALCIYFDFSGCIDLMRGVSRLFDVEMARNFDRPFFSRSISEFWRRWHISLGAWLKNYVFYPVSLSSFCGGISKKLGAKHRYLADILTSAVPMFCVWMIMGVWHGVGIKYVVYGLYYFVLIMAGVALEPVFARICRKCRISRDSRAFRVWQVLRTDLLVLVGLTMFRADTVGRFGAMIAGLFGGGDGFSTVLSVCSDLTRNDLIFAMLLIIAVFVIEAMAERGKDAAQWTLSHPWRRWAWVTGAILLVILTGIYGSGYAEQISVYAQF